MDVRYLLLLIFLVSCLPTSEVSKGNLASQGSSTGGSTTGGVSTTIPESPTRWNYLGTLSTSITINASNLNSSYIVGKNIETYLNSFSSSEENYCLVSRFTLSGVIHELRTRLVRVSYYDFTAKRTVKIFRADFNDVANSTEFCGSLPIMVRDSSNNLVPDTTPVSQTTSNPALICTSCSSILNSSKVSVFFKNAMQLSEMPLSDIDIRPLSLSVDPNNNSSSNTGTCSQSQCAARGFDCCLDNQCITDGSIRPTASSQYSSQLAAAEQERLNNPLSYLNYPHLYYICGSSVPSTTGGSSGGSGSYEQGLTQLKKDYFCVEHMKKNKTGETFHQDLLTGVQFFPDEVDIPDVVNTPATLYPLDIECRNNTAPTSTMHYKKVAERLYQNCGCAKTTLADMVAYCPAYEYQVNYFEASGLPNRIDCYTPNTGVPTIPTQQTVSVNSRSAPHRFFRTCGDEFGSTTPCPSGDNQEGDFFEYQDEGHILPSQQNFGMNSILGQMTVTLDKALPAKAIDIELDQVYQIATTSGFYSPCPTCGKDSWFNSFSAHPTSAYGAGLQSVGFSTERDFFDGNNTGGNYEDTIFGRACWVPPTMLPFSHSPINNTQTQRLNRLKTQAALYANGYQRDWYGFNKGALIGSFDGVSWFAVGKGRIVRSTTKKLFLAINAPFADLASPTLHVVNVMAYDGVSQMAQVDYDPQYHLSHSFQNNAGTCQANHMCSTDTDCITRLGWEYMCADVQNVNSQWPEFDTNAKEKQNSNVVLTIDQILLQKRFPSSNTKRCVYRGSGSLCIQTPTVVADLNKRKTVTCAPNFYCANVNSGSPVFNSKVSRYASNLEDIPVVRNHTFGKDANVLGRPLSYTASSLTTTLPGDVKNTLTQNMGQYVSGSSALTGLCLPGKALPDASTQTSLYNPYEQHKNADPQGRTDYISQIGSCNSGLFTSYRYSSCPVIGSDGNYNFLSSTFALSGYELRARSQNSCGLDSLLGGTNLTAGADALSSSSPFRAIEGKTLGNTTVLERSFARDACLRRAGQVCHTDLDCGPNKLHADQVENFSLAYFGNEAEKKYYSEYLVCGQSSPKPLPTDTEAYKAYSMSNNRCCRPIGSDLTTYTSNLPLKQNPVSSTNDDTITTNDSYDRISYKLKVIQAPGIAPNDPKRYSRLATVEGIGLSIRPPLTSFQDAPGGNLSSDSNGFNIMSPNQWRTLTEANSESCCGGGWIRKFADGTTDWTRRDRLYIDVKNFACINSRSVLLTKPEDVASEYNSPGDIISLASQDQGDYCKNASGNNTGCAQFTIDDNTNDAQGPTADLYALPDTTNDKTHFKTARMSFANQNDFYFYPRSADGDSAITIENSNASGRRHIAIKLPSYITRAWDNAIIANADNLTSLWSGAARVHMFESSTDANESSQAAPCVKKQSILSSLTNPATSGSGICSTTTDGAECCYAFEASTRILKVVPAHNGIWGPVPANSSKKMAIKLINAAPAGDASGIQRTKPGSNAYYLKRLGRLELSGIPQIAYSPLTCNDNGDRIVPGIFKHPSTTDMKESIHFNDPTYSFHHTPTGDTSLKDGRYTNHHALAIEPVFSENDFKCCMPLGKTTTDKSKCCSGFGKATAAGTTYTCAIPAGTDLMVYFNRYVSNEGVGADKPSGGLLDGDFDAITGEPKLSSVVNAKINALGAAYCENGSVRMGGAFGEFVVEPQGSMSDPGSKIYGILDSSRDFATTTNSGGSVPVGYSAFMSGFRWNHHIYCDDQ